MPNKNKESLFYNFRQLIEEHINGKTYQPASSHELMEKLKVHEQHQEIFLEALESLLIDKELQKEGTLYFKERKSLICGIFHMHQRGFGFVETQEKDPSCEDVFIPRQMSANAVDGDLVEVLIDQEKQSNKGPEGKVLSIVKRARQHIAGCLESIRDKDSFWAYSPLLGYSKKIICKKNPNLKSSVGQRVVMKVSDWGKKDSPPSCEIVHEIGHISNPQDDIPAAMEEFELKQQFPAAVLEQIESFPKRISTKEIEKRQDLRKLCCITIDPDTAKDFDDALSIEKKADGSFVLGVHIADVSHYVAYQSPLDIEASIRCNSTYFPSYCLPMLPPLLSENLCSLKANVNRLCVSVFVHFDSDGQKKDYKIQRSVIKSAKRFTYNEALKVLEKKKASPFFETLNTLQTLFELLKKKRKERGCVDLSLSESVVRINQKGEPLHIERVEHDVSHQMVEEFMITANEVVAKHLEDQGKELPFRVHETPNEESLKDFASMAKLFGYALPSPFDSHDLQKLFESIDSEVIAQHLATRYVRSMKMAYYSCTNFGHFGLKLDHYCHFTSPIRRYADLCVHRALFEEQEVDLKSFSERCSKQERLSAKAENSVITLKKLRLLEKIWLKNKQETFQCLITSVRPFGIYFQVTACDIEGFLRISEIGEDYFVYDEKNNRLEGRRSKLCYQIGQEICVRLKSLDLLNAQSEWLLDEKLLRESRRRKRFS